MCFKVGGAHISLNKMQRLSSSAYLNSAAIKMEMEPIQEVSGPVTSPSQGYHRVSLLFTPASNLKYLVNLKPVL